MNLFSNSLILYIYALCCFIFWLRFWNIKQRWSIFVIVQLCYLVSLRQFEFVYRRITIWCLYSLRWLPRGPVAIRTATIFENIWRFCIDYWQHESMTSQPLTYWGRYNMAAILLWHLQIIYFNENVGIKNLKKKNHWTLPLNVKINQVSIDSGNCLARNRLQVIIRASKKE